MSRHTFTGNAGTTVAIGWDRSVATIERPDHVELVIAALLTTRPNPDETFPVAAFATLHGNLAAAFPQQADTARQRLSA
jgi:hypothetical protein